MGRKSLILATFLLILTPRLFCQARQDIAVQNRRIEEEKRADLKPTQGPVRTEAAAEAEAEVTPAGFDYFKYLIKKKTASQSDACASIAILLNIEAEHPDIGSQIAFLKEKGIIPPKMADDLNPSQPLRKGTAAALFCRALGIKGGVILRLFGVTPRYALKELVFDKIMLPGYDRDLVSGRELILILTEAANYLTAQKGGTEDD